MGIWEVSLVGYYILATICYIIYWVIMLITIRRSDEDFENLKEAMHDAELSSPYLFRLKWTCYFLGCALIVLIIIYGVFV